MSGLILPEPKAFRGSWVWTVGTVYMFSQDCEPLMGSAHPAPSASDGSFVVASWDAGHGGSHLVFLSISSESVWGQLDVAVHTCNPALGRVRQEDQEVILSYLMYTWLA